MDYLKRDSDFTGRSFVEESSIIARDISIAVGSGLEFLGIFGQDAELINKGAGIFAIAGICHVIQRYEKIARESEANALNNR